MLVEERCVEGDLCDGDLWVELERCDPELLRPLLLPAAAAVEAIDNTIETASITRKSIFMPC